MNLGSQSMSREVVSCAAMLRGEVYCDDRAEDGCVLEREAVGLDEAAVVKDESDLLRKCRGRCYYK